MGSPDRHPRELQAEYVFSMGEDEEAWLDDMARKITVPYRSDRELLQDMLLLVDLRQRLYTLRVRTREWEDEGFNDPDYEHSRRNEIRRIQGRVDRLAERIETKRALAKGGARSFLLDQFASAHGLNDTEIQILLILLLEDITVSGQKTYSRGRDILGILMEDRLDVLEARRLLYPSGQLTRRGLLTSSCSNEATILDAYFKISEKAIQELSEPAQGAVAGLGRDQRQAAHYDRSVQAPRHTLSDLVLPPDLQSQVRHVIHFAEHRELILDEWGYADSHGRTGQSTILFAGPPGTGKTMAAHAVAAALEKPVLLVSYPEIVSKWVGDTEKNLLALFDEARRSDAVLVFDEADAMFYTRVEVSSATDQSFNREVNVLLQEMERHEGVLILTTNRAEALDPAFERRIAVRAVFPMPDANARHEIWRRHLPERAPLAPDVNLEALAKEFAFSGGHIKNACMSAAVKAASRTGADRVIRQSDLRSAAREEKRSMSRGAADRQMGLMALA